LATSSSRLRGACRCSTPYLRTSWVSSANSVELRSSLGDAAPASAGVLDGGGAGWCRPHPGRQRRQTSKQTRRARRAGSTFTAPLASRGTNPIPAAIILGSGSAVTVVSLPCLARRIRRTVQNIHRGSVATRRKRLGRHGRGCRGSRSKGTDTRPAPGRSRTRASGVQPIQPSAITMRTAP
jgi:hypothetical protein